jgi:nucleotide-binding universal stress UspA family protein
VKVLIGYDGSQCADAAIGDLARAGLPAETEALVLAAADVFPPLGHSSSEPADPPAAGVIAQATQRARALAEQAVAAARKWSEQGAGRVRGMFPAWDVRAEACADTPHWALLDRAARWGADLIVVGSHGRSALGRVLLGSVSQQVLHHAPCSVRIARCAPEGAGGAVGGRPVRLVLGVDGSVDSATAASAVAARAWPAGSEVLVAGVVDPRAILAGMEFGPPVGPWPGDAADHGSRLEEAAKAVADDLRRSGLAATANLVMGDPKRALLHEADRFGADCIFLGAKGHSRLERLLLGSVSATVAARAHCSVEVVRAG